MLTGKATVNPPVSVQKTNQRSILDITASLVQKQSQQQQQTRKTSLNENGNAAAVSANAAANGNGNRKRMSMSDVSDMLYEFYKTNVGKAPKNQQQQSLLQQKLAGQTSPTSAETHEPSSIAAIATNGAAAGVLGTTTVTASKNLSSDEMMTKPP